MPERILSKSASTSAPRPSRRVTQTASVERVAQRAYELFLARGGEHGHDLEDWLQAERELARPPRD